MKPGFVNLLRRCATNADCRLADWQVNIVLKCSNPNPNANPKRLVLGLRYLHRQIFNTLFCPQNLSTVSSDDVICIFGVLF